jgi:ABC-type multidrug transport system ATPase subunit
LIQAVQESLKSVNLFHSGFGDKSVSKYSGGMKRRLSVAIALIGNPKVVPRMICSFPSAQLILETLQHVITAGMIFVVINQVVYMDEPSTGLDTTSRNDLWNVIKRAKKECTIILTSRQFPSLSSRVSDLQFGNSHQQHVCILITE